MSGFNLEPYTGAELSRVIEKWGGVRVSHVGDHIKYELPNGVILGCCRSGKMTSSLARANAKALGLSYPEWRERVGYPVRKSGAYKTKVAQHEPVRRSVTKADAIAVVAEMRAEVDDLHRIVSTGIHGSSFYANIVADAREALRRFPKVRTGA